MATELRPGRYRIHLPIETEDHLRVFVRAAFGVSFPDKQVCPNHSTPWRAFCDSYFAEHANTVWTASRGFGGKSFELSVLKGAEAATLGAQCTILGGSGRQAQRVLEVQEEIWEYQDAPRYVLRSAPTATMTRFRNGGWIRALTASQKSARGPHPQRFGGDEVDEMSLKILDSALGQTMDGRGVRHQNTLSSTHQHAFGTMTEILKRATQRRWPVHRWCWRENLQPHGWLTQRMVDAKRETVTEAMWNTEYDLQEPSPQSRAIEISAVEKMFKKELGELAAGDFGEMKIFEPPVRGAKYAHGADWARKKDWTIIVTLRFDVRPIRVVAYRRLARMSWPSMLTAAEDRVKRYGGHMNHDALGVGDVVAGFLRTRAEDVMMVGRERSDILTEYIASVERGEIVSPRIDWMYGEHKFASVADVYGSSKDDTEGEEEGARRKPHLPDTIAAMALAYSVIHRRGRPGVS